MKLHKNYKIDKLRKLASRSEVGRAGVSEEAIKSISDFDGSYKGAMELCGKLTVLADMSTFDDYWLEQVNRGIAKMTTRLCCLSEDLKKEQAS